MSKLRMTNHIVDCKAFLDQLLSFRLLQQGNPLMRQNGNRASAVTGTRCDWDRTIQVVVKLARSSLQQMRHSNTPNMHVLGAHRRVAVGLPLALLRRWFTHSNADCMTIGEN